MTTKHVNNVLLLDTETNGLDPNVNQCIEIAVCLFDVKRASPIVSYSSLMHATHNDAFHVNKIDPELLLTAPEPDECIWPFVESLASQADAFIAHRAEFDMQFVPESVRNTAPWICSKVDLDYNGMRGDSLVQLVLSLGLGIAGAHRAAVDVDSMSRIFTRLSKDGFDLEQMFLHGLRPKKRFVADVKFAEKDIAKQHGFLWLPERKEWYRHMPPEDVEALPFKVNQIDGR